MIKPSIDAAIAYINSLNLEYIVHKMTADDYPLPQWTLEDAQKCCQLYKNFLILHVKYLPQPLVPTREIDEFWHNHILHTQRYTEDCLHIFGHYLHHQPAEPTTTDWIAIKNNFEITKELYLKEFGESYILTMT